MALTKITGNGYGAGTITTDDNSANLTLKSTDADGGRGPDLVLTRDSASPADGDAIGFISWTADNDAGAEHAFCGIEVLASDVSDGSEDATWSLVTQVAGTSRSRLSATPTETVFNEDSVDVDFRVESNGNANMLVVDGGNDSVGIGTSPSVGLHVKAGSGQIRLHEGNAADNKYGQIEVSNGKLILHSDKENVEASSDMQFHIDDTEQARIESNAILFFKTATGKTVSGIGFENHGSNNVSCHMTAADDPILILNRQSTDGTLVQFRHADNTEGSIVVSGSTVSYNGGHLSRWSQATDGNRIDGLVKGTVLTNLDQMAKWHHEAQAATLYEDGDEIPEGKKVGDEKTPAVDAYDENNEQLNCMAVSSVEGDVNVAGVFVNWDDDDKDFTADMNVAMTGDMVIRIAKDTTVARGDLLMSAGDGTAKPQTDDIVRSKTIAKVTSTTKSHTYDDGSYLVPCVLMAC